MTDVCSGVSVIDVGDVMCAPVGSDVTLSSRCSRPSGSTFQPGSWMLKSDNNTKHIGTNSSHKYRRNYSDHMCTLTIVNLEKTDAGRYSYGSTQRPKSVEKNVTVYVTGEYYLFGSYVCFIDTVENSFVCFRCSGEGRCGQSD